ncbi:hypothetical protein A3715_17565 [Oleiphilus sp. HI0009]|nr:hypothetical protein A3715_17565 [Oleiphilus sp. HI0009]
MVNSEAKATIALTTMAYQIDNKVAQAEDDKMTEIIESYRPYWEKADISLDNFVKTIRAESIRAIDNNKKEEFIDKYLSQAQNKRHVLLILKKMICVDGEITLSEQEYIELIEQMTEIEAA